MTHKILLSIFVVAISLLPLGIIATATFAPQRLMRLIDLDNGSGIIKKASVILGYLFFVAFCFGTAGLIAQPIAIDFAQIWYGDDFLDHELTVIYYFFSAIISATLFTALVTTFLYAEKSLQINSYEKKLFELESEIIHAKNEIYRLESIQRIRDK